MRSKQISFLITVGLLSLFGLGGFHWTVNRIYVNEDESVLLRYKGPLIFGPRRWAQPGSFAQPGEIGLMEQMLGPGRHFYCPIWWERTRVPDEVVNTGEVAIVTHRLGETLPPGEFLVD